MSDDRILEFMALMSDYMRSTDRRFEQLIAVMHDDFERVNTQTGQFVTEARATNQRVDVLTDEVREAKTDVRDMKTEAQTTNRRLQATFEQTGRLTENNTDKEARIVKRKTDNAEFHQRLAKVEEFMRCAS